MKSGLSIVSFTPSLLSKYMAAKFLEFLHFNINLLCTADMPFIPKFTTLLSKVYLSLFLFFPPHFFQMHASVLSVNHAFDL